MEGSRKQPMTESTRIELKLLMDKNLENSTQVSDIIQSSIRFTRSEIENQERKIGFLHDDHNLKRLLRLQEFTLLLQLSGLDLFCSFKFYLNSKYEYENIFSAKLLMITVHEASKKIFHFNKYRNKSIWGKDIKQIVELLIPSDLLEYNKINMMIEELDVIYSDFQWEDKRHALVHYDDNPSKVYELLVHLDIEEVAKRVMKFIRVENEMMEFSRELLKEFDKVLKINNN